jgi:iron complex outermembrane receptor protein
MKPLNSNLKTKPIGKTKIEASAKMVPIMRRSILSLCISSTLFLPAFSGNAFASPTIDNQSQHVSHDSANRASYNITAGALGDVLNLFAEQSGIALTYNTDYVTGLTTKGLHGNYSIDEGLAILLNGRNLAVKKTSFGYTIEKTAPENDNVVGTLELTTVENIADDYIVTRSTVGSKDDVAMKEVPRSISVISNENMETRNVVSVSEALGYTAGVFSKAGVDSRAASFSARGFSGVDTYVDGMSMDTGLNANKTGSGFPLPDTYGLEQISMMRGPSSTLYGNGSLGGVVNLTTKRPTAAPLREIKLLAGSYEHKEGRLDISDSIANNENLRYRLTAVLRDSG